MIYVRVELWPRGDVASRKVLHEGIVFNDGTGTRERGEYVYRLSKRGGFHRPDRCIAQNDLRASTVLREGGVSGFPRLRFGAWHLLLLCLAAALGDELANVGRPRRVKREKPPPTPAPSNGRKVYGA